MPPGSDESQDKAQEPANTVLVKVYIPDRPCIRSYQSFPLAAREEGHLDVLLQDTTPIFFFQLCLASLAAGHSIVWLQRWQLR